MNAVIDERKMLQSLKGFVIPPRPQIVVDIQVELMKDDPRIGVIASLVSQDAGLSGSVLKIANSPLYGLASKVSSVQHAVNLLGLRMVVNLVTALALKSALSDASVARLNRFWDAASELATTAAAVANYTRLCSPDEAYVLGLFHNCGMPLLMIRYPDYLEVMQAAYAAPEQKLTEPENARYKTDHAVLGYYTAKSWNLPEPICLAILEHHSVERSLDERDRTPGCKRNLLMTLKIAEHVCGLYRKLGEQTVDHEWERIKDRLLVEARMHDDDILNIIENCHDLGLV